MEVSVLRLEVLDTSVGWREGMGEVVLSSFLSLARYLGRELEVVE